jgi:putative restriction endonuclease
LIVCEAGAILIACCFCFGSQSATDSECSCPNHHVLFDLGAISVNDDLTLIGLPGRLTQHPRHKLNIENLRYHREHYSNSPAERTE